MLPNCSSFLKNRYTHLLPPPPTINKLKRYVQLEVLQIVPTILPKHQLEVSRSFKMKKLFKPPIHTSILSYYAPPKPVV